MHDPVRKQARVGVFGAGHWMYWQQFEGLLDRLLAHQAYFEENLAGFGVEVLSAGMVDTPTKAVAAGDLFRREGVDLLICFMSTYALSSGVLPVVQRAGAPMIIASLQPTKAMDYANGTTWMQLEHDNQTSLPEVCNALERADIHLPGMVVGCLDDDACAWGKIKGWCGVANALAAARSARIGLMGHTYEGMLDMNADPTMLDARFGLHCEHLELDDLHRCVAQVGEEETEHKLALIRETFAFPAPGADPIAGPADPADLRWAAQVACGLDRLKDQFGLNALAYYYRGLDNNANQRLGASLIVGSS